MLTVSDLRAELRAYDDTTLRGLFDAAREEIMFRQTRKTMLAANQFRVGDLVSFRAKSGARVIIMVAKVNTKTLSGVEVDPTTRIANKLRSWRVTPTLATKFSWPAATLPATPAMPTRAPSGVGAGTY